MKNYLSELFGLQGLKIRSYQISVHGIEIGVKLNKGQVRCPYCGKKRISLHQKGPGRSIEHQLLGDKRVILNWPKNRWLCKSCCKVFTEVWPGQRKWSRRTLAAEQQILCFLSRSSFRQMGKDHGISDHVARHLLKRAEIRPIWEQERNDKEIRLGVDEHSFRGRDLVISVTNIGRKRLKAILPDDRQETLRNWLRGLPEDIKKNHGSLYRHEEAVCHSNRGRIAPG